LIDLTIQELAKVNAEAPMPLTEATFCDVLEPYFAMVQGMDDKVVQQRIVDNILLKFLVDYSVVGEAADEKLVFDQIHVGTISEFIFHLGSDATTRDEYRKNLYDAHKEYQRRINSTGRDVDIGDEEDGNEDVDDDDEDEAPQLQLCDDDDDDEEEGEEVVEEEDVEPEQVEEPEPEPEVKKSKKKRKRVKGVTEIEPIVAKLDKPVTQSLKTKKAKDNIDSVEERPNKKSKKDNKDSIVSVKGEEEDKPKNKFKTDKRNAVQSSDHHVNKLAIPVAEQKKVKKTKKGSDEECDKQTANMDAAEKKAKKANKVVDEEIVISVAEQKKAKKAAAEEEKALSSPPAILKKKTKKKKKETDEEKESRRVSFGRINHSKSHKASMRDLKNASPKPLPITPDKSILRVKSPTLKPVSVGGKIAKRKKAADYF
jgi:hypothetical protein